MLFVFWKSPFSQVLINWAQALGIGFNRVIDITDLFALIILPLSFSYFQKQLSTKQGKHKYLTVPLGIVSLFAIWATTLPREQVDLNLTLNEVYEMHMSKADFFHSIQTGHGYSDTLRKNLADSLFYLHFNIVDKSRIVVTALATITSIDSTTTKLRLDKILHGYISGSILGGVDKDDVEHFESISEEKFKIHFKTNFIKPIADGKAEDIYYDNKEIYDSFPNN